MNKYKSLFLTLPFLVISCASSNYIDSSASAPLSSANPTKGIFENGVIGKPSAADLKRFKAVDEFFAENEKADLRLTYNHDDTYSPFLKPEKSYSTKTLFKKHNVKGKYVCVALAKSSYSEKSEIQTLEEVKATFLSKGVKRLRIYQATCGLSTNVAFDGAE